MKMDLNNINPLQRAKISALDLSSVHFIGLGAAGSKIISFLHSQGVEGKFTYVTDSEKKDTSKEFQFIHFSPPVEIYEIDGLDPIQFTNREMELELPIAFLDLFKSDEFVVLVSGLGGYTGTNMTEELTLMLHYQERPFLTISSLPFNFEGQKRNLMAQNTVDRLEHIERFHYFKLEDLRAKHDNLTIKDAFEKADEQFYEMYKSIL